MGKTSSHAAARAEEEAKACTYNNAGERALINLIPTSHGKPAQLTHL